MSTCETCWADAYTRTLADPSKSQAEHYLDLLAERKDRPCPPPAEVVRAWVARDGDQGLCLYWDEPSLVPSDPIHDEGSYWESDGYYADLPRRKFPTLAPGECWPVEIRRIKE